MSKNKNRIPKTDAPTPIVPTTPEIVSREISHNPALLEWPTDIWGLTKELKKAFLAAASRLAGHPDKKELLDQTLLIAHGHLEAKFKKDSEHRVAKIAKAQEAEAGESIEQPLF